MEAIEIEQEQGLTPHNKYAIRVLVLCVIGFVIGSAANFKLIDIGISPQLLLIGGAPLVLFIAYLRIELALILFIYTIPIVTYSIPGLPFYFSLADAFLIVLVAVWFSRAVLRKEFTLYRTFLDRYIFIFMLLSTVSLFNSRSFEWGFFELLQTLEFFVFSYYFFCTVAKKQELVAGIFQAITFSSVFFSLCGLQQYFSNRGTGDFRIYSMLGHFNAFGAYLAMMILVVFNLMLVERDRLMKWAYIAALGVNFAALMLTYSRGAWIAMVIGIMVSAWLRGLTQFVKIFSISILFFIMLSMVVPSSVIGRAASITRVDDKTSQPRLKQYKIAVEAMSSYPLLGVGITSMDYYVWEKYEWEGAGRIHNLFLWIGAERGVPAMVSLLAIFGVFFLKAREKIERTDEEPLRAYYIALFTAPLVFFIVNLTALHLVRGLGIFLGMFFGLFQAIAKMEEEKEAEFETPYYIGRATTITRG